MSSNHNQKGNVNINAVNSIEEANKFDELLIEYSKKFSNIEHPSYLSLANCWERIQGNAQAGKIFTAVFDIKLTLVLLNYDAVEIEAAYSIIKKDTNEKHSIVGQSTDTFFARVNLHRSANAYILRYRAMFDKLMGLMVLIHSPDDYQTFLEAKSRRREFKRIAYKHQHIFPPQSIENLLKSITIFDNGYRTSEAHHSGKLRKYSFSFDSKEAAYFGILQVDSWNYLIEVIRSIDKHIGLSRNED